MGDVNAVYTFECAHRRQLLAARALHERSLLITGLPFPSTKTIGDVCIDDLVVFHRPSKCSEPMLCMISSKCLRMRAILERRFSLMLVTMLISAMGVNRTLLRRVTGGCVRPLLSTRSIRPRCVLSYGHFTIRQADDVDELLIRETLSVAAHSAG